MSDIPPCPGCKSPYGYDDGSVLVCPECGHAIDCKIDGIGAMKLKSEFVTKA